MSVANFLENWEFFALFPLFDSFIHFFGIFQARLTLKILLNPWMYFDFKHDQPFSKYQSQKVNFSQFT